MNWEIFISYPWWFVLLCILAGVLYAGILYYRSKDSALFAEYPVVKYVLPAARFLLATLLCFLLLGPVLKYVDFNTQKPIVAILVDDTKSMAQSDLSAEQINQTATQLSEQMASKYDVQTIRFSNVAQFSLADEISLEGSETNIASALRYTKEQYVNQNLGGAILLTDGIYNAGSDPSYLTEQMKVPVYTIGVGDTTIYADLQVQNVSHNSLAYLGNDFPFRVVVNAQKLKGKLANLQVQLNGATISQKQIVISKESYFEEVDVVAKANKLGQNKVDVRLTVYDNEKNKSNNAYSFYIDVIDGKKKVGIWAEAPHPDLGMLKSLINANANYDAHVTLGNFQVNEKYDLVILHDWFANPAQLKWYEKLRGLGVSVLVVAGDHFQARIFNSGSQDVKFESSRGGVSALPTLNGGFEYFELSDEAKASIKKWPPLKAPFGKWRGFSPNDVLLYQQIGSVTTQEPLVMLRAANNVRMGIVAGSGLWQWKLAEYEANESHQNVTDLISKMVQYLAVVDKKKLLKVYPSSKHYGQGETVTLLGELYNQSLDAIAGQEINVNLLSPEGKVYKHTMTASGSQYRLLLNGLADGVYEYTAKSTVGGVLMQDKGTFTVTGEQKELSNLTADFNLLRKIAAQTGAAFYPFAQNARAADALLQNEALKSVITEDQKLNDWIKLQWLFWLLFGLLALEWFVRKWIGGY